MRRLKRGLAMAFMLCMMILCITPVQAQENAQQTEENVQLTDLAKLLSETEAQEIEQLLAEMEERTGWDLMALTTDDAGGEDATSYAESWFDKYTSQDDGVICAIDMDNREIVVRAFGEAMYYITDKRTERILDAGYDEISVT